MVDFSQLLDGGLVVFSDLPERIACLDDIEVFIFGLVFLHSRFWGFNPLRVVVGEDPFVSIRGGGEGECLFELGKIALEKEGEEVLLIEAERFFEISDLRLV